MDDADRTLTAFSLPDLASVEVQGSDAGAFLDRLMSADIAGLGAGGSTPSCLLDAQGFLIATMDVHRRGDDAFLLTVSGGRAGDLHAALDRFLLMDDVTLTLPTDVWVGLCGDGAADSGGLAWSRTGGAPCRGCALVAAADRPDDAEEGSAESMESLRIRHASPTWGRELTTAATPLEAGLAESVVTSKCYPGQEAMARTINLGRPARTLVRLEGMEEADAAGADLFYGERRVGRVTSTAPVGDGVAALALVRTRRATEGTVLAVGSASGPEVVVLPA